MLQKMLHGLQVPGYAADQQKKVAYFPSPAVASDCMKRRHANMRSTDNKKTQFYRHNVLNHKKIGTNISRLEGNTGISLFNLI